jgi:hypothetical protein
VRFSGSQRELKSLAAASTCATSLKRFGMAKLKNGAVYLLCEGAKGVGIVDAFNCRLRPCAGREDCSRERALQELDIPAPLRGKV